MTRTQGIHAPRLLVVGGTGMLLGTVRGLLEDGHHVWALARRAPTLEHPRLHPLLVDYSDADALEGSLSRRADDRGPFDGAIVWAHGSAPHVPEVVSRHLAGPSLHVLGSANADPSRDRTPPAWAGEAYRTVVLGFVREGGRSRWLTHAEISAGVLTAWQSGEHDAVVGTVRPWSARP